MATLRDAITDVPGVRVGHWTARRSATGCTSILVTAGAVGGIDVRGAAPGTRETDLLRPGTLVEQIHAVVLSGGSAFGLATADGVMRYLAERGVGLEMPAGVVPIVPAAILYDLALGTARTPDAAAGYRAAAAARAGTVAEGSVGAGTGATVAKLAGPERRLKGGLGTASESLDTGVIVGAIAAVNAAGCVRDGRTGELLAAPRSDDGGFIDVDAQLRTGRPWGDAHDEDDDTVEGTNTTLAVVATNAKLNVAQANRLATVCHDGFARTLWPVHTRGDGDVVFALATGDVEIEPTGLSSLEAMACRAVERAILRGVRLAEGLAGVPSAREWQERREQGG